MIDFTYMTQDLQNPKTIVHAVMDRDPKSSQRIENGLETMLAQLNARWRLFARCNQHDTTMLYVMFESTKHKRGVNCVFSILARFSQLAGKPVWTGCS